MIRFSPIENLFGYVKRSLKDFTFRYKVKEKPLKLAKKVSKLMFDAKKTSIEGFYKKTLLNMIHFWLKLDRNKLIKKIN